jgi:hypothetical protein
VLVQYAQHYSDDDLLRALSHVAREVGDPLPSERQYDKHKLDRHPHSSHIRWRFGGWPQAQERLVEWEVQRLPK